MKIFKLPVTCEMYGFVEVESESVEGVIQFLRKILIIFLYPPMANM